MENSGVSSDSIPAGTNPGQVSFYRYNVGDIEVIAVSDGERPKIVDDNFLTNVTPEAFDRELEAVGIRRDGYPLYFYPVLVRTGSKLVALDCGNEPAAFVRSNGAIGLYQENLERAGLSAQDVDVVAFSHFHSDHIGGLLTAAGDPAFPSAEIKVPAPEWDYWMDDGNFARASSASKAAFQLVRDTFLPLRDRVTLFAPGVDIAPGVRSMLTAGHTPGHTVYVVESSRASAVVQGDLTFLPQLFVRNPGWHAAWDMDGLQAEAVRRALYDQIVADGMIIQGYHFPFPSAFYAEKAGDGYRLISM
jgi:glyoxylase-like metal-dependent hydrolase (beta-lactamase superfamily II)